MRAWVGPPVGSEWWWTRAEDGIGVVSKVGDCVIVNRSDSEGGAYIGKADPLIAVSMDLLEMAAEQDWPEISIDGRYLGHRCDPSRRRRHRRGWRWGSRAGGREGVMGAQACVEVARTDAGVGSAVPGAPNANLRTPRA